MTLSETKQQIVMTYNFYGPTQMSWCHWIPHHKPGGYPQGVVFLPTKIHSLIANNNINNAIYPQTQNLQPHMPFMRNTGKIVVVDS